MNINTHAHTHKYNHTHTHKYNHTHTHSYTYIYINTHTYTHTHTFLVFVLGPKMCRAAPVHIQHVSLDLSKKKKHKTCFIGQTNSLWFYIPFKVKSTLEKPRGET